MSTAHARSASSATEIVTPAYASHAEPSVYALIVAPDTLFCKPLKEQGILIRAPFRVEVHRLVVSQGYRLSVAWASPQVRHVLAERKLSGLRDLLERIAADYLLLRSFAATPDTTLSAEQREQLARYEEWLAVVPAVAAEEE